MATQRELVYNVLEKVKSLSDDQLLTEDYIAHLIDLKREYLLDQKFSDYRKVLPEVIKQTIEFQMVTEERVLGLGGDNVKVSRDTLPALAYIDRLINSTIITGRDFLEHALNLIPYERFIHVGKDRILKNQIYATFRDGRLYLKSGNNRDRGIWLLNMTGVFSSPEQAYNMSPQFDFNIPFADIQYPLTNKLADTVVGMVTKDLLETLEVRPDVRNNASET